MKVKESEMFKTKKFPQMKELKIKLHRLDKAQIATIINSFESENKMIKTFNFSIRKDVSNSARWQCQEKDGKVEAVVTTTNSNNIQIQIRKEFEKSEDCKAVNKMSSVEQVKLKKK